MELDTRELRKHMHLYIVAKAWIPIVDPIILKRKMQTKKLDLIQWQKSTQNNVQYQGGSVFTSLRKARPEFGT